MPMINFIEFSGREHQIEVPAGTSVMRAAVDNGVPGIDGDCDGACACATCHVYVDPAWLSKTGERTSTEEELLSFASAAEPNSRLACQVRMTEALDGLLVRMPEGQH
ncbi:2Fe-2S iron-sulfur cluster-binding protein [Bradyrhizobium sp. CCGUVB1N3]|uniref:2Fe-2S iron-sulfur cluster-binding protein n=1 Tax=Bradyrhizobium sp. CCGUVB1N3 TaxID=2949629 RepID=UPI0020B329F1|nr:2Fe-2S iron-sulfur cluster-binding protein [Bradyrhizobium sp. CCGUVB1N3]MCP3476756.1 2Fe-2S iron-sulfur cluster-binding protein [Bradyrhizobium sp. CCGUVB1N3]